MRLFLGIFGKAVINKQQEKLVCNKILIIF